MKQNDFLVALFGRPVWLHCKKCQRVKAAGIEDSSQDGWLEEVEALHQHNVGPEELWWFHTLCDLCQDESRPATPHPTHN